MCLPGVQPDFLIRGLEVHGNYFFRLFQAVLFGFLKKYRNSALNDMFQRSLNIYFFILAFFDNFRQESRNILLEDSIFQI
jgi:hypothetical protein